jgi:hypothetical protein
MLFKFLVCASIAAAPSSTVIPGTGGQAVPNACVLQVSNGALISQRLEALLPSHCFTAPSTRVDAHVESDRITSLFTAPSTLRADAVPNGLPNQVYALDAHVESDRITSLVASFTVPQPPANWLGFGNVNYLWPGFKASEPSIGFPVLQPVLQYGQDGASWQIQSYFVNQQRGGAASASAPPLRDVVAGDVIDTSMVLEGGIWTVYGGNRRTGLNSTLRIAASATGKTAPADFNYAMFVYETIMPSGECNLLSADDNGVTFENIAFNGDHNVSQWIARNGRTDCNLTVAVGDDATVKMTWAHTS